jgi:two-component system, NarL family, sensor kinase
LSFEREENSPVRRTVFVTILICFGLGTRSAARAEESQKLVLAIYAERNNLAGNALVDETIRKVLNAGGDQSIDFRSEYVNNVSSLSGETSKALRDFLRSKYAGERIDVILAIGTESFRVLRSSGVEMFPEVPVVGWGGTRELWSNGSALTAVLEPDAVHHAIGQVDFILTLQPDLRELFIVAGTSDADLLREASTRQALKQFENRVKLTYLTGMSLEDLRGRLSTLPAKTAISFLSMNQDGAGRNYLTRDVLAKLALEANAPMYARSAVHIGSGIVGGFLIDQETMAREAAEIVLRILQGERVADIPYTESSPIPKVDSRALRRWKISENRLPPGTTILFREPSLWDAHKWRIIGILSLCIVEASLILTLLIHKTRRKRAESEVTKGRRLLQSTIDAMDTHIILLDEKADIIAVNESWRRSMESLGEPYANFGVGKNYLDLLESCDTAVVISEKVRDVMRGESTGFCHVYQNSSRLTEPWFQLKVHSFLSEGTLRMALTHQDITELKRAHQIQEQHNGQLLHAQDEERRRIARDLHEVTAQNIAMVKAELSIAWAASTGRRTAEQLREGILVCDQVIKELRTLSYLLHPPFLDDAGLVPALRWYVRGFVESTTIDVEIMVTEDIGRLSIDTETALFRVVQESLTNIHRHSGSRSAVVWLTKDKEEVVVRIQDDGCGMNEKTDNATGGTPGVGIIGMRHRLRQLGGRLEIESDSHGTTVTARTPISREVSIAHSGS